MHPIAIALAGLAGLMGTTEAPPTPAAESHLFRPPAVPLVTHDPYLHLVPRRPPHRLLAHSLDRTPARDAVHDPPRRTRRRREGLPAYRAAPGLHPRDAPILFRGPSHHHHLYVRRARHSGGGVNVTLSFCSPLLPDDLDLMSPFTYITWQVNWSAPGGRHYPFRSCRGEPLSITFSRSAVSGAPSQRARTRPSSWPTSAPRTSPCWPGRA